MLLNDELDIIGGTLNIWVLGIKLLKESRKRKKKFLPL